MKYIELRSCFKNFIVFSFADIKKIDPSFFPARLNEWQKKGYIRKIIRGYYYFSDQEYREQELFYVANKIFKPSYISMETALSWHNLIPEAVYGITSVATRRTRTFKTPLASFFYRTVSPSLFFGYRLELVQNAHYAIAEKEKAVLDYCYLNSRLRKEEDFAGMRVNSEEFFRGFDREKFNNYLERFKNSSLERRISVLLKVIENA